MQIPPEPIKERIRIARYRKYSLGYDIHMIMEGLEWQDDLFLKMMQDLFPDYMKETCRI